MVCIKITLFLFNKDVEEDLSYLCKETILLFPSAYGEKPMPTWGPIATEVSAFGSAYVPLRLSHKKLFSPNIGLLQFQTQLCCAIAIQIKFVSFRFFGKAK